MPWTVLTSSKPSLGSRRRHRPLLLPPPHQLHYRSSAPRSTLASFEIFEGIASFALTDSSSPAHHDDVDEDATFGAISSDSRRITFRASILASSWETRVCLALRPLPQGTTHGLSSKTAESGQPAQPLPAGTKRRRDESVAPTDAACELLVRFESSGRVLQGRLLHGHVMRMREDVTLDAAAGREATTASTDAPGVASQRSVAPYVRLQLTPHLELTLSALPEHSNATATEQLQRLVTRLLDSLRPPPASSCADAGDANRQRRTTGATAPTFAASAVNDASATDRICTDVLASTLADTSVSGGQASVAERTATGKLCARCARELADEPCPTSQRTSPRRARVEQAALTAVRDVALRLPQALAAGCFAMLAVLIPPRLTATPPPHRTNG